MIGSKIVIKCSPSSDHKRLQIKNKSSPSTHSSCSSKPIQIGTNNPLSEVSQSYVNLIVESSFQNLKLVKKKQQINGHQEGGQPIIENKKEVLKLPIIKSQFSRPSEQFSDEQITDSTYNRDFVKEELRPKSPMTQSKKLKDQYLRRYGEHYRKIANTPPSNPITFISITSVKPSPKTPTSNTVSAYSLLGKIGSLESAGNSTNLSMREEFRRDEKRRRINKQNEFDNDLSAKPIPRSRQKMPPSTIPLKEKRSLTLATKPQKRLSLGSNLPDFGTFIALSNKIVHSQLPSTGYKACIGKGNNSILVKTILKNRYWWNFTENEAECHLFWTQGRNCKFLQALPMRESNSQSIKQSRQLKYKKYQFQINTISNNAYYDKVKEYVGTGLHKLLSEEERNIYTKSQTCAEFIVGNNEQPATKCQAITKIMELPSPSKLKLHNHLEFNWNLSNKKALYYNLKSYYLALKTNPFDHIPETYHVQKQGDNQWNRFVEAFENRALESKQKQDQKNGSANKKKSKNLWIIKPGQNSNRGCGIQLAETLQEIRQIVKITTRPNGKPRSHIIQKYLLPFLYNRRKFDIRCYILVTTLNGHLRCYWYEEGYIRTASKQFTVKNIKNRMIHLTNDAVQKHSDSYGKYQSGNKLSFMDFQKYLTAAYPEKDYNFFQQCYPSMMKLAADAIKSTHSILDASQRLHSFEIFGLDFMIDEDFATWLIEINTNPCLELSSPLLARIIPSMLQNALKIAVDPLFPPPKEGRINRSSSDATFEGNRFTLIFNSEDKDQKLKTLQISNKLHNIIQFDEEDDEIDEQEQE